MRKVFPVFLLWIIPFLAIAQEVIRDSIPFHTVEEINSSNDSLIDATVYPEWRGLKNHVYEITIPRKFNLSGYPEEYLTLIKNWLIENNVEDDGRTGICYGLVKNKNNIYEVRKVAYQVSYLLVEVGGGGRFDRFVTASDKDIKEIICLFNDSIVLDEKPIDFHVILPHGKAEPYWGLFSVEKPLNRNTVFRFQYLNCNYELEYTAQLCSKQFSYKRYRTKSPEFYNNVLTLKNIKTGTEQIILKLPHSMDYKLTEIMYGDIDNDGNLDVIYTICHETCKRRLVFLSSRRGKEPLLLYIGHVKVYCNDP